MSLNQPDEGDAPFLNESVSVDENQGTLSVSIPLPLPKGRAGWNPELRLTHSGQDVSPFGRGWSLPVSSVVRSTTDHHPRYKDGPDGDGFQMTHLGELVPERSAHPNGTADAPVTDRFEIRIRGSYDVIRYHPVRAGEAIRIERWQHRQSGDIHWRERRADGLTLVYGRSESHRVTDPSNPEHVWRWLLECRFDAKGNGESYEYKQEDGIGVDDRHPGEAGRLRRGGFARRYLKRIRYGNSTPVDPVEGEPSEENRWHYQVVFDYGEHEGSFPDHRETADWPVRPDPRSEWTSGFEIRTWRLCRRLLIYHDMPELGSEPVLTCRYDFTYDEEQANAACGISLTRVSRTGVRPGPDGSPVGFPLPSVTFNYSEASPDSELFELGDRLLPGSRPTDLFGDGVPGLLRQQGRDWFYRRAIGRGRYGSEQRVEGSPADNRGLTVGDLEGHGHADLVRRSGRHAGYHLLNDERSGWDRFQVLPRQIASSDGLRGGWMDLSGDGRADRVVEGDGELLWFGSEGREGYREVKRQPLATDRAEGPATVSTDPANGLFVANLSGSGQDIVEVDNGRIAYWPHLGYGRYGDRIEMSDAPVFDPSGTWLRSAIRFADLNGSGLDDLIFLGQGRVQYWINESGNGWSSAEELEGVPPLDSHHQVDILDLFGEGTPVLLSSDSLPGRQVAPLRYRRLVGSIRPGRLTRIENGMGRVIDIHYSSSAEDWYEDRARGVEWDSESIAHRAVVRSLQFRDRVAGTVQEQTYRYRHLYMDGLEGRFSGFGHVEVTDSGTVSESAVQEDDLAVPTCRRIWFHDGRPDRKRRLPGIWDGDPLANSPVVDASVDSEPEVDPESLDQGWGRLAGRMVREELFEGESEIPLTVREQIWNTEVLTAARKPYRAVCRTRRVSEVTRFYEGVSEDPRTVQSLELQPDLYGYPELSCRYDAPRRKPIDQLPEQGKARLSVNRITRAHLDEEPGATGPARPVRFGIPVRGESFTCFHAKPEVGEVFDPRRLESVLDQALSSALPVGAEDPGSSDGVAARRETERLTFYADSNGDPTMDSGDFSLPLRVHHEEQLAFTDEMLDAWYGERMQGVDPADYGYQHREGVWWSRSNVSLWLDREGFCLPAGSRDYRGRETTLSYDGEYRMVVSMTDLSGLETTVEPDYRAMKPAMSTDPNGNRVSMLHDGNGQVIATRHQGEEMDESGSVRTVGGPVSDWSPPIPLHEWSDTPDLIDRVMADPQAWAGSLSSLHVVDPFAFRRDEANGAVATAILMNSAVEGQGEEEDLLVSLHYSDGMGRTIQSKHLDREGAALEVDPDGELAEQDVDRRWKTSEGIQYDNKGQPTRRYKPFFSTTHRLEKEEGLNRYGAATRYIYDGLGRTVRVESPDGFESRMEHGAWSESSHDPNDTIQDSFFYKSQVETGLLEGPELATIRKAEEHADTPTRSHLVPGGFPILQEEWLDEETALRTRSVPDAHGRVRHVLDPRTGEKALEQTFDVAGRVVWSRTPDSGERRTFFDAAGRPHLHWTAKDECLMTLYDDAWRVVSVERGAVGDPSDRTVLEQVIHGEAFPDREEAIERNLLGRVWKQKDPSGEVAYPRYDSRGNLLEKRRRLASQWRDELDWSGSVELEDREFVTRMVWDGLGREVGRTTPDGVYQSLEYQPSGDVGRIRIRKPDETEMQTILSGVEMDAAGRLNRVHYGNGVESVRSYEERSGRLKRLVSRENRNDEPDRTLQEMTFYWDPAGNLARKDDRTREHLLGHIPGIHNDQSRACDYTYDALYRLTKATGWTHLALQGGPQGGGPSSGWQGTRHFSLNDGGDLVPYERQYTYDLSGNLTRCRQTGDLSWTREMWVSDHSNRSLSNEWVERTPQTDPESRFDAAGNLRELEHLDGELQWGTRGELLKAVVIEREDGEPDAEHYRYGHDGMRLRRISERVEHGRTVLRETLWLDGCEIRREHRGDQTVLEKTSTTIEWNGQNVAVLDRLITDSLDRSDLNEGESRLRYHLCDHRGSVALELTDQAELISYEEFFPYGGSAFMAGSAVREASRKVYGYNGVEREDATGLCHIGYRSYAPWLCRWISPDPSGPADGLNLYAYLRNSPVQRVDPDGLNSSIAQDFEDNRGDFKELGTFYDYTGVRYYETYKHETHGYVGRYVGYMDSEGEYQEVDADEQPWLNEEQLRNLTSEARQNEADEEVNEADREGGVNESGASSEPDNEPPDPPDPDASDASDDTRNSSSAQSDARVEEPNESETSTEPDSESADPNTSEPSDGTGNSSPEQSDTGAEQPNENSAVDENQGQPSSEESAIDSFKDSTSDARKAAGTPGKTMNTISQYFESLEQGAVDEQKRMEVLSRIERSEVENAGSRARHFQDAADRLQSEQVRIADELADARTDANMSKSALDQARMASKRADDRLADLVRNAMDTSGDPDWMVEHVSEDLRRETDMSDHRFGKAAEDYDRARANAPSDARLSALEDQHASAQSRLEEARRASRESGALSSARDEALSEARDASRQERQAARRSRAAQTGLSEAEGKLSRIRNGIQLKFGDGRIARLVEKVAPAARGVSKVLGPIGSAMSIHSLVTAENAGEVAQSLMDIGADVAGYVPHPLTMTFSLSYGATQLADSLSGGRISGGAAEATFQYDQFRGELLHGAASTVMEDPPPAYKMTAGWQIAGFLENRGIRF